MKSLLLPLCIMLLVSCSSRKITHNSSTLEVTPNIRFSEGKNGTSFNEAVIVHGANNQREGIAAEQHYISLQHGTRGRDWFLVSQTVIKDNNKVVDVVEIELGSPTDRRIYFFDATDFIFKN